MWKPGLPVQVQGGRWRLQDAGGGGAAVREGFRRITGLAAGVCGGAGVQAGGKRDEGSSGHFFFLDAFLKVS